MGVVTNNSFLVQIKTEDGYLTAEGLEKILKKKFRLARGIQVKEYYPPYEGSIKEV